MDTTAANGTVTKDGNQPLAKMPGPITQVVFDSATKVAQALGQTPDGTGWTVYAIETNGNAVFSDAPSSRRALPFQPVAIGLDSTPAAAGHEPRAAPGLRRRRLDGHRRRRPVRLLVAHHRRPVRGADGRLPVPADPDSVPAPVGRPAGRSLLADRRDALRPVAHRHERHLRRRLPVTRVPASSPSCGSGCGSAAPPSGWGCRSSASSWAWPWRPSGWRLYAMASIGILILIRSALGRLITILGLAGRDGHPGLDGDRRDDHPAKHGQCGGGLGPHHPGRAGGHRRVHLVVLGSDHARQGLRRRRVRPDGAPGCSWPR